MSKLLLELNPDQRQATLHKEGPAVVLAGAGSGKTRVLTTRVAWLLQEKNLSPEQILLVTFTNKAAAQMQQRVWDMAQQKLSLAGTFHRVCAGILRQHGARIGLAPGYIIHDSDDQLSLIKKIYKREGLDPKRYNPRAVKASISSSKNELISPSQYESFASGPFQECVSKIYRLYNESLRQQDAVDFDDLLLLSVKLFKQENDLLGTYQERLEHVLVDEYQDTNLAQYTLTRMLTKTKQNLFVVGDFSQSIYAWRGADYRNMLKLHQDFPDIKEYRLEQNYRSTQTILDAASNVIAQNTSHPVLKLWTDKPSTEAIECVGTATGETEAAYVLKQIHKLSRDYEHGQIAILYRTNAQSRRFEEIFVRSGIDYRVVGGLKFYERKEIKDVLAYLKIAVNPKDMVSRLRAEKLGKRRLAAFDSWLEQKRENIENPLATTPPLALLEEIIEVTTYAKRYKADDPEDAARLENIKELLTVATQFNQTSVFLENIALVQDDYLADGKSKRRKNNTNKNIITLMSLHSAKGLEFPVVFMVGMEDGLLPHSRSLFEKEAMEEERRLCYVGITRAKEKLFFSYAKKRWQYGKSSFSTRSRFLSEIPKHLLSEEDQAPGRIYEDGASWRKKSLLGGTKKFKPKRRLIVDDSDLSSVLSGDMDINAFLETS